MIMVQPAGTRTLTWTLVCAHALLLLQLPSHALAASKFSQYRDCASCVGAGFGWSAEKAKCGGYATKVCAAAADAATTGTTTTQQGQGQAKAAAPANAQEAQEPDRSAGLEKLDGGTHVAAAEPPRANNFDADILAKFAPFNWARRGGNTLIRKRGVPKNGKPWMVFNLGPRCSACKKLKGRVNAGTEARGLFDHFNVICDEKGNSWRLQPYDPHTYYFNAKGMPLHIESGIAGYKYYYGSEDKLADSMRRALAKNDEVECEAHAGSGRAACLKKREGARKAGGAGPAADLGKIKARITALYQKHNPSKLQAMLTRYAGREQELLEIALKKYKEKEL